MLLDVDQRQLASARKALADRVEGGDKAMDKVKSYDDYRTLLDEEPEFHVPTSLGWLEIVP